MAKEDIDIELGDIADEWETSSGLPLADADVEVVECSFGFNAKLGADVLCANFVFKPLGGDGETIDQSFSVGKGWEAKSKGAYIVREDGRGGHVNKQTNYGRLIESVKEAVKAAGADIPFKSPRIASGWVGTRWHVGTETVTTTNPTTGKESTKEAFIFTAYLGAGDTEVKGGGKSSKAGKGEVSEDAATSELRAKLIELAKECDDPDDFVEKALAIPGVEDGPLEAAVLKHKKPDSIWQIAKGGE